MKLFIVWLYEMLQSVFPDSIPSEYDWSDQPVGDDEIVIGDADDDLLRIHKLWKNMDEQADSGCQTVRENIMNIMRPGGVAIPIDKERLLRVGQIAREHALEHEHAELVKNMLKEEIQNRFPESLVYEKFETRQGRKIVGFNKPPDEEENPLMSIGFFDFTGIRINR